MQLDDFIEDFQRDEAAEKRRLAEQKSYEITDYLDEVEREFEQAVSGDSLFGATAPEIFVGRSSYPNVSTGVLSPVTGGDAADFATSGKWYQQGLGVSEVLQRRTGLLNSTRSANVDVRDVWDGFVGVQREVAIADHPVDVEVGLDSEPDIDLSLSDVGAPTGPQASAESADLAENPHVPRPVEKTLEDDDWQAEGAMTYLYRRGFDVYDINTILSAGALGQTQQRRLVPTRWSITAVDDTVGQYLRGRIRTNAEIGRVEVHRNEFLGNAFWVILAPGKWEYELVEMKAPGSVWNPDPEAGMYLAADSEGREGRTGYVEETAGAYHAARLAVLEHLDDRGRQGKALVLRHVSDDYWGPVGVWQVREAVRDAFAAEHGSAETFAEAVRGVADHLPVSLGTLRRKSTMAAGLQTTFGDFG